MAAKKSENRVEFDARQVWPSEATDFTPWLLENLHILSRALKLDLQPLGSEVRAGSFFADLVAYAEGVGTVVIENQLGATDHSHMGKLMTYAAGLNAAAVVWVSSEFREEHRKAIEWINLWSSHRLHAYAVELSVKVAGNGDHLPTFRPVVAPSGWRDRSIESSLDEGQLKEPDEFRTAFLRPVAAALEAKGLVEVKEPKRMYGHYYLAPSGLDDVFFCVAHLPKREAASVQILLASEDVERSKRVFDRLAAERRYIEGTIGSGLSWERGRSSEWPAIRLLRGCPVDAPLEQLRDVQKWMVNQLPGFMETIGQVLARTNHELDSKEA